jgi:RNA polymerase sigma factor (sigma-70 family)
MLWRDQQSSEDKPPPSNIEPELIRRVLAGEDSAWHELLVRLTPLVARTVRTHLRREGDREDLVQEVLTRVFLNIRSLRDGASLEQWVTRIAINACHDWLRKMKARPAVHWSDLDPDEAEVLLKTLSGRLSAPDHDRSALFELLDKLLSTLKPREQIVIRLLDLEGHSIHDACALTGWGSSKVRVTAMRARKKLATQFRRLGESPFQPPT